MVEYKLMMTWDIRPGYDQQYFEFMLRDWSPGLAQLGLQPRDAWYTAYGDYPQFMASIVTDDLQALHAILGSDAWGDLHERLLEYVENYEQKIVRASPGLQL